MGLKLYIFTSLFAVFIHRALITLGYWNSVSDENIHFPNSQCDNLLVGTGAEDMATTSTGLTFITTGLMYPPFSFKRKEGAIYLVTVENGRPVMTKLKFSSSEGLDLNPHGIDLIETKDGRILIYVVNHSQTLSKESIEKFEYKAETKSLAWKNSFTHSEIYSINDLTLLSEDEFFATNDHYFSFKSKLLRALETFTFLRLGSVIYCKGNTCSQRTPKSLHFPNGIQKMTVDSKELLYVAQSGVKEIARYEITEDRNLKQMEPIKIIAGMDNFWLDPKTKDLTITGHPKPWQFVLKSYGQSELSPSVVFKLNGEETETIFYDDGSLYMSGSICALVDGVALLGSPNGNLMACYKK